jgi:bacteriorhodopsin
MDWLLTVPLLLIEIVLVMNLGEETFSKAWKLGVAAALMIILGYPGELILEKDQLSERWLWWCLAMIPFMYVVYTLLIGLRDRANAEADERVSSLIRTAQWMTVLSWLTYPIVFIIPMFAPDAGANVVVGIQVGYCMSDIISKCGVGMLIYNITWQKSQAQNAKDDLYHAVQNQA